MSGDAYHELAGLVHFRPLERPDVKAALRAAHPDRGGEADDFRDVIAAREGAL